nr:hypothetical protein GCM10020093_053370 [Planobispora longispora]
MTTSHLPIVSASIRAASARACSPESGPWPVRAKRQPDFTRSTFAVAWYIATWGGAVAGRAASTASAISFQAATVMMSISASRLAKRRWMVVLDTPAASAICSIVAPGFSLSTRSAASMIVLMLRSASARSLRPVVLMLRSYTTDSVHLLSATLMLQILKKMILC